MITFWQDQIYLLNWINPPENILTGTNQFYWLFHLDSFTCKNKSNLHKIRQKEVLEIELAGAFFPVIWACL